MCQFVAGKRFLSLVMEQKAETKEMKKVQPKRKKIKRKRSNLPLESKMYMQEGSGKCQAHGFRE